MPKSATSTQETTPSAQPTSLPMVAIVGRTNVGKSTLFNRIAGQPAYRGAIVADLPGTTRDRITAVTTQGGRTFMVVDTGGLEVHPDTAMAEKVQTQAKLAIAEADLILFLTDAVTGVTATDYDITKLLRQSGKPVVLVANKVDNPARHLLVPELYALGLGDPVPISAYHNLGISDLVELVVGHLPPSPPPLTVEPALHLAIVGRPNVGKSMLLNALLGQERAIVSEAPGTTRDALDTPFHYRDTPLVLIDTAGIRHPGRVHPGVEKYSILRALRAILRADVVFLVLDATELAAAQDAHVAAEAFNAYKGIVIVVNKWDMKDELRLTEEQATALVRSRFRFISYAPVRFVSALRREGLAAIMDTALEVEQERRRQVPSDQLKRMLLEALARHPMPQRGRQSLRIYGIAQTGVNPPTFTISVSNSQLVHFSYARYLENTLRSTFGFRYTHLRLQYKAKREKRDGKRPS